MLRISPTSPTTLWVNALRTRWRSAVAPWRRCQSARCPQAALWLAPCAGGARPLSVFKQTYETRACSESRCRAGNGLLEGAARRKARPYRSVWRAFATPQIPSRDRLMVGKDWCRLDIFCSASAYFFRCNQDREHVLRAGERGSPAARRRPKRLRGPGRLRIQGLH